MEPNDFIFTIYARATIKNCLLRSVCRTDTVHGLDLVADTLYPAPEGIRKQQAELMEGVLRTESRQFLGIVCSRPAYLGDVLSLQR